MLLFSFWELVVALLLMKLKSLQGYFQILYSCIEKLLAFLNVKSFVLPATDEAKSIWTEKFGFRKIPEEQVHELPMAPAPFPLSCFKENKKIINGSLIIDLL